MLKALAAHRRPALILLRLALFAAVAVGLYEALRPVPPGPPSLFRDQIEHFLCFYGLTGLALLAYPRLGALRLVAVLAAFGAAIEGLQALPLFQRDAEFLDWVADLVGVAAALLPALALPPLRAVLARGGTEP